MKTDHLDHGQTVALIRRYRESGGVDRAARDAAGGCEARVSLEDLVFRWQDRRDYPSRDEAVMGVDCASAIHAATVARRLGLGPDFCEDLAQAARLGVIAAASTYPRGCRASWKTYAGAAARNACYDEARRRLQARERPSSGDPDLDVAASSGETPRVPDPADFAALRRALGALPAAVRRTVEGLYGIDRPPLSVRVIAESLGVTPARVVRLRDSGLKSLRAALRTGWDRPVPGPDYDVAAVDESRRIEAAADRWLKGYYERPSLPFGE